MTQRIISLFLVMCLLFVFLIFRIYFITTSSYLNAMAKNQNTLTFEISTKRGNIYDRNFNKIVNDELAYKGILDESFTKYHEIVKYLQDGSMLSMPIPSFPYMLDLKYGNFTIDGVTTFSYFRRYSENQLLSHIIGYINSDNNGVTGIEKDFNEFLKNEAETSFISYNIRSDNKILDGSKKVDLNQNNKGIVISIDKDIQYIIEEIGKDKIDKGAILVTDSKTNEILGMASFPNFNPYKIEDYINDENKALLNRNLLNYNIGSIFKLLIAGVALESGVDTEKKYYCKGYIEVNNHRYNCHKHEGHGYVNMNEALAKSCNPYFVEIVKSLTSENLYNISKLLGFSDIISLSESINTDRSILPSIQELKNIGERSLFSFGQGKLMGSTLHVANLMNAILNDGFLTFPKLIYGEVYSKASTLPEYKAEKIRIFSKTTSDFLKKSMKDTVFNGTGIYAKSDEYISAGKTGTAQTGQFDENNNEYLNGWFSGFYPYDNPKYTIIILLDKGGEGGINAAPIFKEILDNIDRIRS